MPATLSQPAATATAGGSLFDKIGLTGLVKGVSELVPALAPVALAKYQLDQQNANLAANQGALNAQVQSQQIAQQQTESDSRRWFVLGGVVLLGAVALGLIFRRR